jgi:hypothetical protein
LLNESVVNRNGAGTETAVIELVGRVADDDIELHIASEQRGESMVDMARVDEVVGVCLEAFAAIERGAAGTAESTPAPSPCVLSTFEPDIAGIARKTLRNGVLAAGVF